MAAREGTAAHGSLLQSIKHLGRTALGAAQTRLEILATEIEEERVRLEQMLLVALAAAFCLAMAIVLTAGVVVLYFWDSHRLLAAGVLAALFFAAGAALALMLRQQAKSRPKAFAVTRGELAKDRDALQEPRA